MRAQVGTLQQTRVGGYGIARFQQDDIAGNQLAGEDILCVPVAPHAHVRHRHALQRRHGLLGAVFLRKAQQAVEQDYDHNHHGVDCFA